MQIIEYDGQAHAAAVGAVLGSLGWEQRYIDGQLAAVTTLAAAHDGCVYVAMVDSDAIGYVSAVLERWNMLGHIHGLAVDPSARRGGVAKTLVAMAEQFLRSRNARGVRVDTPVNNLVGRGFYEAIGFTHDYTMTRYYADDLDGVTYVRFY